MSILEGKHYTPQLAHLKDLPRLLDLEKKCWPEHLRISKQKISTRLKNFPEAQFAIKINGQIVGIIYTQRIAQRELLNQITYQEISTLHTPTGSILQLLSINVDPDFQDLGLGDQLLEFVLQWSLPQEDILKIVAVTRCQNYKDSPHLSMSAYLQRHEQQPLGIDSILRFHTSHGAKIVDILPNYRSEDCDNQGAGILVEYAIREDVFPFKEYSPIICEQQVVKQNPLSVNAQDTLFFDKVFAAIKQRIPEGYKTRFSPKFPLREIGFDSLGLLDLRLHINEQFQVKLDSTFFFAYPTPEAIAYYLQGQVTSHVVPTNPEEKLLTARLMEKTSDIEFKDDVAIIGMGCRFPKGIQHIDDYWHMLEEGLDLIGEVPQARWKKDHSLNLPIYQGGFLTDVDKFDASFFHITPREAELMDPQQRILLETSWQALEHSGIDPFSLRDTQAGVFLGIFLNDYERLLFNQQPVENIDIYFSTGNSTSVASGRLSYVLGFQGPSMTINTACSSALVAVHLACQSLRNGETSLALAGGVNLILSPELSIAYAKAGMLSPEGRCKTFDIAANGYVRGEGCGIVVLKRLSQAINDQDNILAVIRGSAVNQDGASNGLTAPNKAAQIGLIKTALANAKVTPHSVSYVESHGTGTSLGDPIEAKALLAVYGSGRSKENPLMLGSVKTNLGHTEGAAGVASLIKVVLALQKNKIPAHLHFKKLNPHIELDETPLLIPTTTLPWPTDQNVPRRAGISSFGFSGTNAHLILEEAPKIAVLQGELKPYYLVTLSAKHPESLSQQINNLHQFLASNSGLALESVAYTLNRGRSHFHFRFALITSSREELIDQLAQIQKGIIPQNCFQGDPNKKTDDKAIYDEASFGLKEKIKITPIENVEEYKKILVAFGNLYVRGYDLDWDLLHQRERRQIVSLPTYPFLKERYWLTVEDLSKNLNQLRLEPKQKALHPLLDKNISTFKAQIFQRTFSPKESYLDHHIVAGQSILPGTAYLEMARAAGSLAGDEQVSCLKDVMWQRPIINKGIPIDVRLELIPTESGQGATFQVFTQTDDKRYLHVQGELEYAKNPTISVPSVEPINVVIARCKHLCHKTLMYSRLKEIGFEYGETFQVTQALYGNENEGVAELHLPTVCEEISSQDMVLHPMLLDGVVRTIFGIQHQILQPIVLQVPFYLESITIYQKLPSKVYAHARLVPSHKKATQEDVFQTGVDIDVLTQQNELCASLRGYQVRTFRQETVKKTIHYYQPQWLAAPTAPSAYIKMSGNLLILSHTQTNFLSFFIPQLSWKGDKVHINLENDPNFHHLVQNFIDSSSGPETILHILPHTKWNEKSVNTNSLETIYLEGALVWLQFFQAWQAIAPEKSIHYVMVYEAETQTAEPHYSALASLARAVKILSPNLTMTVLGVHSQNILQPSWVHCLHNELLNNEDKFVYYASSSQRFIRHLVEIQPPNFMSEQSLVFHKGSTYLITGGCGGLGKHFARFLSEHYQAKIILLGRSPLDLNKEQFLAELKVLGGDAYYVSFDLGANQTDLENALSAAIKHMGNIQGILHAAGTMNSDLADTVEKSDFLRDCQAKIQGTIQLDQASQNYPLDFFITFSSISSEIGDFGRGSYAFGNRFMDEFMNWRGDAVERGLRRGLSLSIQWPYWAEGGMQLSPESMQVYQDYSGLGLFDTEQGFASLRNCIALGKSNILVVSGDKAKLEHILTVIPSKKNHETQNEMMKDSSGNSTLENGNPSLGKDVRVKGDTLVDHFSPSELHSATENYLKNLLAEVSKIPIDKIQVEEALERYGIDSIMIMTLNKRLSRDFPDIRKTLLFEYRTLSSLAQYFIAHHSEILATLFVPKISHVEQAISSASNAYLPINPRYGNTPQQVKLDPFSKEISENSDVDGIAIIGLFGRYPQAETLEDFWLNLCEGKDSVVEIPLERWDWRPHFDGSKTNSQKTYSKWGSFIQDCDKFDPSFFNISPKEAKWMDPQERLLLEAAWATLEDGGYAPLRFHQHYQGEVGVFVGIMWNEYALSQNASQGANLNNASLANRISYYFNFSGPSLVIDTACSSSLVSIHMACESIHRGEIQCALAGGVNLSLRPNKYVSLSQMKLLSSEGKCRSFGAGGDGYVPGEGLGLVLLKPLSKALQDKDKIYGVIRSTYMNHGGKTNGFTVPNPDAQAALIKGALKKGNIPSHSISYIEAHGTGTALGDPIEITGLCKAFDNSLPNQSCPVGSVKSNIGHLEGAAGIVGLTKILLQLKHKQLVPSLHSKTLNPYIEFEKTPFYVQRELKDWHPKPGYVRRACISSFGAWGVNAHAIIDEAPLTSDIPVQQESKPYVLVTLSAKHSDSLIQLINNLYIFLQKTSDISLEEFAYIFHVGRNHFNYRFAIIVANLNELKLALKMFTLGQMPIGCFTGEIEKTPDDKVLYKEAFKKNIEQLRLLLSKNGPEYKKILEALANLYIQGFDLDWELLYQGEVHQKISLPTYPFLKKRYWYDEDQNFLPSSSSMISESHQTTFNTILATTSLPSSLINLRIDEAGVALVILEDKARKNQLSKDLLIELEKTFQKLNGDSKIKTIVITGYDDLFCLGGTEEGLIEIASKEARFTEISFIYQGFLNCSVPVIAAMQGHAFGAGLTLGLYADMVVMSESHLYTANYMKYGFTPGVGSTLILKEKLTPALANEMMWTAQDYTGADLKSRGAQVTIVPAHEVLPEALRLAQSLAKKPRETLQVFKQQMTKHLLAQLPHAIEKELAMHEEIFSKPTALNSVKSYFDKLASNKSNALSSSEGESSTSNFLTEIIMALKEIVADRLHFQTNEVSTSIKFNELGADSISIVEITRSLNQRFSLSLEAIIMYDYPTIESLAEYILAQKKTYDFFLDSSTQVEKEDKEINLPLLMDAKKKILLKSELQNSGIIETNILQRPLQSGTSSKIQLKKKDFSPETPTFQPDILKQGKIAVIGMSGKFPGAKDLDAFWKNLREGCCSISEIPENRWKINRHFNEIPQQRGKTYSKWGGFLDEVDQFDPLFFNISPQEALEMDPQQRLFLQVAWEALEDAGLNSQQLSDVKCSVFVGVGASDYGGSLVSEPETWTAQYFLGMNNAILASRIAYLLNLKGPAIAIDTACSSSLVAIHQACQSILQGESELALAGGVSVMATPKMHILCSQMGMLSPTGQCRTFDADADGMVPAEGVGVVLLKSLEKALLDKDRIYGVIVGSGVNQDGATNGITAPSVRSQEELESTIYSKHGISPEHITYVEAHGTGTKLGDPIEVKALKQAFKQTSDKTNYCAIGSVKTNIGHALTAAGVSSFIKVLLMLKHKTLVSSLHYEKPNSEIDFTQSPFYVNKETIAWERLNDRPLLAAVSSFGFSGTNAHVVIEEAPEQPLAERGIKPYYLVTLSAKHADSLIQQIQNLYTYLDKNSHISLEDVAYTLNKGRSHFHFRCAVIISTLEELKTILEKLQDAQIPIGCFKGEAEKKPADGAINKKVLKGTLNELKITISNSLNYKENLETLASLYVKGYDLDWDLLHQGENHQKVNLPTYPFLKERYWLSGMGSLALDARYLQNQSDQILHPLLGRNVSTLEGQCYQTHLQSDAFYLNDHVVKGKLVLPGVCHLEMARVGGEQLYPLEGVCGFKNIVWSRSIEVESEKDVYLRLFPKDRATYFEVCSQEGIEKILYSQGEMIHGIVHRHPQTLDLSTLQKSLSQEFSFSELNRISYEKGFRYGPSFQGLIQWLKYDGRRALAYVSLPEKVREAKDRYIYFLHPSFLDGVLQTTMALTTNQILDGQIYLPFCIEELKWFVTKLPDNAYVFLEKDSQSQEEALIYNLQVSDDNGELLLQIKGFNVRPLKFNKDVEKSIHLENISDKANVVLYRPSWESTPLSTLRQDKRTVTGILAINLSLEECARLKTLLRCEVMSFSDYDIIQRNETWVKKISELPANISHLIYLAPQKGKDVQHLMVEKLFLLTQILIKSNSVLVGTTIYCSANSHENDPTAEMVNGFMKNLAQEQPRFHFRSLLCSPLLSESAILDLWLTEIRYTVPTGAVIRYEANQRYEQCFQNINKHTRVTLPLRNKGSYLITGGLGGVGYLFARYLADRYQANLILSGRSILDKNKKVKVEELKKLGAEILYFEGDISQERTVQKLLAEAKKRFGTLNGIFHAAGILKDSILSQKTLEEFRAVLAPKMWGLIHLDALTIEEPIELFVLFSSLSSILGNRGQSDYASANAFLDSFAHWRQAQVEMKKRNGKTLSINWPLWKEGGMQITAEDQEYLQSLWGLRSLPSEEGLQAFEQLISLPISQGVVLYGAPQSLVQLDQIYIPQEFVETTQGFSLTNTTLQERIAEDLLKIISKILKIPRGSLRVDQELLQYGFDSLTFTQLATQCNQLFNIQFTPARFFEFSTVEQCAQYLLQNENKKIRAHYEVKSNPIKALKNRTEVQIASKTQSHTHVPKSINEEIAIIGMQAILPGAKSIDEFWQLLLAGENSIQEIPPERWNWRDFEKDGVAKWGGFIDGIDEFDPLFFSISPHEAESMDPQHRLFLQVVWQTMEDAGYTLGQLQRKKTGLFVGTSSQDYAELLQRHGKGGSHASTGVASSILANRVSYLLNLTGPSEAIDTACSSSLVALHHAIKAIQTGDCELAFVGGVNALLTPSLYLSFSRAGMLSQEGLCRTFDKRANGYVRGEGVGVILLKTLSQAEKDNDLIYGVIKGSSVNHGGHANSLTAPNPNAQAELIVDACQRGKILAESISYIETHGTGTSLGDPIEINGLKKAFHEASEEPFQAQFKKPYCALGSVKANIGHLEAAAGIAGVIKVLCMFKHKTIPPQANFELLNPYIELEQSPFYIAERVQHWETLNQMPRRAGISSFGFGGTNAHVLIEEIAEHRVLFGESKPYCIVTLSAKHPHSLKQRISDLYAYLKTHQECSLENMAYTLNVGRDHFNHRCALVVSNVDELRDFLEKLQGDELPSRYFAGQATESPDDHSIYKQVLQLSLEKIKKLDLYDNKNEYRETLEALANLYVKGYNFDWELLHQGESRQKLRLPTYPFLKEKYWIPIAFQEPLVELALQKTLHPLLDENNSTLNEHCFKKIFTGKEFYLTDHCVQKQKILPGAAYLEMVRAAAVLLIKNDVKFVLKQIIWSHPLGVGEECVTTTVSLNPLKAKEIEATVWSNVKERNTIHMRCLIYVLDNGTEKDEVLQLESLREEYLLIAEKNEYYRQFAEIGIDYGSSFQAVENIYRKDNEAFAELYLSDAVRKEAWYLYPGFLDAALQTGWILISNDKDNQLKKLKLPFSVEEVEIRHPVCDEHYFAYAQTTEKDKFNVVITDEKGKICVKFWNVSARELGKGELGRTRDLEQLKCQEPWQSIEKFFTKNSYIPVWKKQQNRSSLYHINQDLKESNVIILIDREEQPSALSSQIKDSLKDHYGKKKVLEWSLAKDKTSDIENFKEHLQTLLSENLTISHIYFLASLSLEKVFTKKENEQSILDEWEAVQRYSVGSFYSLLKALIAHYFGQEKICIKVLTQGVHQVHSEDQIVPYSSALTGFVQVIAQEYPHWHMSVIDLPAIEYSVTNQDQSIKAWVSCIIQEGPQRNAEVVALRNDSRYFRALETIDLPEFLPEKSRFHTGGVYWIIGGANGIGYALSQYLAKNYQAHLIWIGRRPASSHLKKIVEIEHLGGKADYFTADVANLAAMKEVLRQVKLKIPQSKTHGVIHSALVLADALLKEMDHTKFATALRPKMTGSVVLYELFKNEHLDFMMFFSSVLSFIGSRGQSNYAAGTSFQDAFGNSLAQKLHFPVKIINWGYWKDVGAVANEYYRQKMAAQGIESISIEEGMRIIEQILLVEHSQLLYLKTSKNLFNFDVDYSLINMSI